MTCARLTAVISVLLVAACSAAKDPAPKPGTAPSSGAPPGSSPSSPSGDGSTPGVPPSSQDPPPAPVDPPLDPLADPATYSNPEEVQVLMKDAAGAQYFCTGTLLSALVVLTAAHCVDPSKFVSYEVVAATLASDQRVTASHGVVYDPNWDANDHPDLGLLKLTAPIVLGEYATLTDVTTLVDSGQAVSVGAIVRDAEQPLAPFLRVGPFNLTSATAIGYAASYAVPMFSKGGDSGCGFFLIENGKQTHKLVAVEHDLDPARGYDYVSRVDATFIQWVQQHSAP